MSEMGAGVLPRVFMRFPIAIPLAGADKSVTGQSEYLFLFHKPLQLLANMKLLDERTPQSSLADNSRVRSKGEHRGAPFCK